MVQRHCEDGRQTCLKLPSNHKEWRQSQTGTYHVVYYGKILKAYIIE